MSDTYRKQKKRRLNCCNVPSADNRASAEPRWIPVEERLPEKSDIYYVTCHDGVVRKSAFYVGAFDRSAIAWMPKAKMPEPFEPKDK